MPDESRNVAQLRHERVQFSCRVCGHHPANTANWCALGCGRDYNEMIPVHVVPRAILLLLLDVVEAAVVMAMDYDLPEHTEPSAVALVESLRKI